MKFFKSCLVTFAVLLFAAACNNDQTAQNTKAGAGATATTPATATPAPTPTPDELAAAAADYSQFCINCHKADGTGGTADLDGKKIKVLSLREHGLKDSDEHLAEQIREGGDDMPAFKNRLDKERIDNLVRYVRREFHGRKPGAAGAVATPAHKSH